MRFQPTRRRPFALGPSVGRRALAASLAFAVIFGPAFGRPDTASATESSTTGSTAKASSGTSAVDLRGPDAEPLPASTESPEASATPIPLATATPLNTDTPSPVETPVETPVQTPVESPDASPTPPTPVPLPTPALPTPDLLTPDLPTPVAVPQLGPTPEPQPQPQPEPVPVPVPQPEQTAPPLTLPTAATPTVYEPQADPIPQTVQLPAKFALQSAVVAAERAAGNAAARSAATDRAFVARNAGIVAALTEYDAASAKVDTATRADADARADHATAVTQSALVHRLALSAGLTAAASQVSLAALVRAMAQGEAGTATADALLNGGSDANLLYRLGALDRLGSLTENIQTVRARVVADRQRADDLAEQDAELVVALDPAPVAAAAADLTKATAAATASRERLLALGAELSMTGTLFSSGDTTFASLLFAADAGVLSDQGWALPAVGRVTSGYGPRPNLPVAGVGAVHHGTDLGAGCGTGVYAATSGIVAAVGEAGSYGNWILIDHGEGVATGYAHVATGSTRVAVGDRVSAGQVIAAIGSTGASTGCHLHFEVRLDGIRVDAVPFLQSRGIRLSAAQ